MMLNKGGFAMLLPTWTSAIKTVSFSVTITIELGPGKLKKVG